MKHWMLALAFVAIGATAGALFSSTSATADVIKSGENCTALFAKASSISLKVNACWAHYGACKATHWFNEKSCDHIKNECEQDQSEGNAIGKELNRCGK